MVPVPWIRKIGLAGMMLVAFAGSLLLTLWLTEPARRPKQETQISDAERLGSYSISSRTDLIEAAVAIGLHGSGSMRGSVDNLRRLDDQYVIIDGWLADPQGNTNPLILVIFVAGKKAAITQTRGERPDVTKTLGLAFGTEKNVAFQVSFRCLAGDQPFIVAVGTDKQYLQVTSPQCP